MWCDVMSTIQRVRICKRCISHPNRWHTFCDNFWLNGCIRSPPLPPIRTTTTATRMHQTCNFRRHNKDCCTLVVPFMYWLYECNSIEIYFYIKLHMECICKIHIVCVIMLLFRHNSLTHERSCIVVIVVIVVSALVFSVIMIWLLSFIYVAGWLLMMMMVMVVFIFVIWPNWCRWEENSRCQKATIILSKVRCFRNGQWPKTVHLHKSFSFKLWSVYQSIPYSLPTYILYRMYIYIFRAYQHVCISIENFQMWMCSVLCIWKIQIAILCIQPWACECVDVFKYVRDNMCV